MNKFDALRQLEEILSEARSAVLATTDKDGIPRLRWMNPVFLKDKAGTFYCLTSPGFEKSSIAVDAKTGEKRAGYL